MGRVYPSQQPGLLWRKNRGDDFGDWLDGNGLGRLPRGISAVPNEVLATAFFAHSTEIVAKMAGFGRKDDAEKYGKLFDDIKAAFNREYVAANGASRATHRPATHWLCISTCWMSRCVRWPRNIC